MRVYEGNFSIGWGNQVDWLDWLNERSDGSSDFAGFGGFASLNPLA